jgi:hypothetical protein
VLVALLLLVFAGLATSCSGVAPAPSSPAPSPAPSAGYSAAPDGSVEATGYVAYEGIEGGFWALYDRPPGPSSVVQPKILAVLLPDVVTGPEIAAMEGVFVKVTGRLSGGASVRMAGPEVFVATIAGVSSDTPR